PAVHAPRCAGHSRYGAQRRRQVRALSRPAPRRRWNPFRRSGLLRRRLLRLGGEAVASMFLRFYSLGWRGKAESLPGYQPTVYFSTKRAVWRGISVGGVVRGGGSGQKQVLGR